MGRKADFNRWNYATVGHCYFNVIDAVATQDLPLYLGRAVFRAGYRSDVGPVPAGCGGVLVVLRGGGTLLTPAGDRPAGDGTLVWYDSDRPQAVWRGEGDGLLLSFLFTGAAGRGLLGNLIRQHGACQQVDPAHPTVRQGLDLTSRDATHALSAGAAQALVWDFLRLGWPEAVEGAGRIATALLACLAERDPVASAARRLGLSREHLSRRASLELGRPPRAWLARERLNRAAILLATTDLPVRAVAGTVGFTSPTALCGAFRRVHGLAPSAFRRARPW